MICFSIEQSLKWNYTQQVFLWKLLELHTDIQVDHMLSLLPKINFFGKLVVVD